LPVTKTGDLVTLTTQSVFKIAPDGNFVFNNRNTPWHTSPRLIHAFYKACHTHSLRLTGPGMHSLQGIALFLPYSRLFTSPFGHRQCIRVGSNDTTHRVESEHEQP
jgi:hypothetical protein